MARLIPGMNMVDKKYARILTDVFSNRSESYNSSQNPMIRTLSDTHDPNAVPIDIVRPLYDSNAICEVYDFSDYQSPWTPEQVHEHLSPIDAEALKDRITAVAEDNTVASKIIKHLLELKRMRNRHKKMKPN